MKLIYVYYSDGCSPSGSNIKWDITDKTNNRFVHGFLTEGWYYLLKKMLEHEIIDEVLMIIESTRGTGSFIYNEKFNVIVLPNIDQAYDFVEKDDIFYIRGGARSWFPFLEHFKKKGHWFIYYDANTGRYKWPFWDVILDDLCEEHWIEKRDIVHFKFSKPVHPEIFKPVKIKRDIDFMIGASFIHDKKGQWIGIKVLEEAKKLGYDYKAILAGSFRRGEKTNEIQNDIKKNQLNVSLAGFIPRPDLNTVYNRSKVYCHFGAGCNDRGLLEALSCGCQSIVSQPKHHAPFANNLSMITDQDNFVLGDFKQGAKDLIELVESHTEEKRQDTISKFTENAGIEKAIIPQMRKLFDYIKHNTVKTYLKD